MIKDISGINLTPGNLGKDCLGNGERGFEICCDECDYLKCCINENYPQDCPNCADADCPRKENERPL